MPEDVKDNVAKDTEEGKAAAANSEKADFKKLDADEIVKPYIDRITKEQAKKNDYKSKYEDALKEVDRLRNNNGKSAKEIT